MPVKLTSIRPRLSALDTRRVQPPPKTVAPIYQSAEFKAWRETVIANAGRRCEAVDDGRRCTKAEPRHRMYADHVKEVRDGGALYDPANGQCLCGSHHSIKTAQARAARR